MKFTPLTTKRLADPDADEIRRNHQLAIEELRAEVRRLEARPHCIGFCEIGMSANDSLTSGEAIDFDTPGINTTGGLVEPDGSYAALLQPGYTYRLFAYVGTFNSTGHDVEYHWHNETDDEELPDGISANRRRGFVMASDSTRDDASTPAIVIGFAPTKPVRVYVKAVAVNGTPIAGAIYSNVTIEVYQ